MLLPVLGGVVEAQVVDVVEEAAELVFEHPRDVGAAESALVDYILHGEVLVEVELAGFNVLAYALLDSLDGALRGRHAWRLLIVFGLGWRVGCQFDGALALRMEHDDEQHDVADGHQQPHHGYSHLGVGHDGNDNGNYRHEREHQHLAGEQYGEIVFVGVVLVEVLLHPLVDFVRDVRIETKRGGTYTQNGGCDAALHLRLQLLVRHDG